jgi:hypothetical protein
VHQLTSRHAALNRQFDRNSSCDGVPQHGMRTLSTSAASAVASGRVARRAPGKCEWFCHRFATTETDDRGSEHARTRDAPTCHRSACCSSRVLLPDGIISSSSTCAHASRSSRRRQHGTQLSRQGWESSVTRQIRGSRTPHPCKFSRRARWSNPSSSSLATRGALVRVSAARGDAEVQGPAESRAASWFSHAAASHYPPCLQGCYSGEALSRRNEPRQR